MLINLDSDLHTALNSEHILYNFVNDLETQTMKKKLTATVFIDLLMVFDTVDSSNLLKKNIGFQKMSYISSRAI